MIIVNKTPKTIMVDNKRILPNNRKKVMEKCFDTHNIIAENGSIEITTSDYIRYFGKLGTINFKQIDEKDSNGLRVIEIC